MTESTVPLCDICGLVVDDARLIQQCFTCDRWFHLNPRQDVEGIDCGDAWLGPNLGVEYYCQVCIDEQQAEALDAHDGDARRLAQQQVMQMVTPGAMLPDSAPRRRQARPAADARTPTPPPKPVREPRRRRYRRLDG
jgi:hypothetical protein